MKSFAILLIVVVAFLAVSGVDSLHLNVPQETVYPPGQQFRQPEDPDHPRGPWLSSGYYGATIEDVHNILDEEYLFLDNRIE